MTNVTDSSPGAPGKSSDTIMTDPAAVTAKIQEWQQRGYHVLSPATRVWGFAAGFGVNVSMVVIDSTVHPDTGLGSETYFDRATMKAPKNGDDVLVNDPSAERAIALVGLSRIAACAGVMWDPHATRRTDDRRIVNYWEFTAWGSVLTIDGTAMPISATKEVDLRDDSAQIGCWTPAKWDALLAANASKSSGKVWSINGWSEKRVIGQRAHGARLAESKAKAAAIRSLGLKHKYTVEELRQPFVVLRAVFVPDMTDPETRRLVTMQRLVGSSLLYAPGRLLALQPYDERSRPDIDDREPITVPTVASAIPPLGGAVPPPAIVPPPNPVLPTQPPVSSSAPAPALETGPSAPATLPPGARFVKSSQIVKTGKNANGNWTKFGVVFEDGLIAGTFSETIAAVAAEAQAKHLPVTVTLDNAGKYGQEIKSITLVDTTQPALFGDPPAPVPPAGPAPDGMPF